jgi:PAS domain S-box-containing protein
MEIIRDVRLNGILAGTDPASLNPVDKTSHSDDSYRGYFQNAREGFFQTTPDGRYLRANPALARMYGYDSTHELIRALTDLNEQLYVDPKRRAEFARLMKDPGEVVGFESQVYRKDGSIIWISEDGRVVRDAAGHAVFYEGNVEDITARKQAESNLGASQRFIERVAQASPNILYVYDLIQKRYVYANERVHRILGYTAEDLTAMGPGFLRKFSHPDDEWLLVERMTELSAADDGRVFEYEFRLLHADGNWRWINARETVFNRLEDGRPHEVIGTAQDITDRKNTLQALQQSEERFRKLVEGADVLFWERDLTTGRFTYVGPQAEKLLGYPAENWYLTTFWLDHVHTDDRDRVAEFWRGGARRGDDSKTIEYRLRGANDREVWVRDFGHLTMDEAGNFVLQGFMLDVTERQAARIEIRKSHEQLRALSARLHTAREEERMHIAREIHDELGGALTALKMDVSRVGAAVRGTPKTPADAADEKIKGMLSLIDQTMESVRRIATELRPPILDAFGVVAAIEWQVAEFQRRFGIRTELQDHWNGKIAPDQALSTALFRIFQEMLTNVARHSQATNVVVRLDQDREHLMLSVRDNGRGITEGERRESLGLLGMSERAGIFGGRVEITGASGVGTLAVMKIPLKHIVGERASEPKKERLWR